MKTVTRILAGGVVAVALFCGVQAQQTLSNAPAALPKLNASAPLQTLEKQLRSVAEEVLRGKDFARKIELNELLKATLQAALMRPESFDYRFDSLTTLSRIYPEDQSFRIFTWVLRDPQGTSTCHGMVQRKITEKGQSRIVVIPLSDKMDRTRDIQRLRLNNEEWLGALYYKPRNSPFGVLTFKGEYEQINIKTQQPVTVKDKFYVIMGLNEHNAESNYKILDVISFDPKRPDRVYFGAPIFYTQGVPQSRIVLKYADNAACTLNYMPVQLTKSKNENMIVFDHLTEPDKFNPTSYYTYGADGGVDAFRYYPGQVEMRRGVLVLQKNVRVYEAATAAFDNNVRTKQREKESMKARQDGLDGFKSAKRK